MQARALGTALADERIDLCVVTEFERVRETAEIALAGRDMPFLVVPELNDPRYGEFEGGSIVAYREWAWARGPLDAPAGGEHRGEIAGRYARGLRILADRPEDTILLVAHSLPLAYLRDAAAGTAPRSRMDMVEYAQVVRLERGGARAGRRRARGLGRCARLLGHTEAMLQRVESLIREQALIEPAGEVTVLVSGGADSTCLWHVLGGLGYRVSALHVAHGLRGAESDEDARFCRDVFGAEIVVEVEHGVDRGGAARAPLLVRDRPPAGNRPHRLGSDRVRPARPRRLRLAAADQGAARGRDRAAAARRLAGGDARLLRASTGSPYREDSSNPGTKRGLIRNEILPLLEQLDPRARASLLSLADERPRLPRTLERTLVELLASRDGTKSADLGAGVRAVREYGTLRLEGSVEWGPWTIASERTGLEVRARRPGDRLAGRRKKVQDLLVDAKVPRAERDGWPLVVLR